MHVIFNTYHCADTVKKSSPCPYIIYGFFLAERWDTLNGSITVFYLIVSARRVYSFLCFPFPSSLIFFWLSLICKDTTLSSWNCIFSRDSKRIESDKIKPDLNTTLKLNLNQSIFNWHQWLFDLQNQCSKEVITFLNYTDVIVRHISKYKHTQSSLLNFPQIWKLRVKPAMKTL